MSTTRVLVVAFDAANRDIVREMALLRSRMPVLEGLIRDGLAAETINPPGLFVGSVWTSFLTGVSPARHGRYAAKQIKPGTYGIYKTHVPTTIEPFWADLARAGRRTAVMDVPAAPLVPSENGVHITGWGIHDSRIGLMMSSPPELISEIQQRFGPHPAPECDPYGIAGTLGPLRDDLLEGIRRKGDIAEYLLRRGDWDLFMVTFSESHCVGHQTWHVHDPRHPRHDPEVAAKLGDPIEDVYAAEDAQLGRLVEIAGEDAAIVVLLSHGMGPHYDATYLLDEILFRIEHGPSPSRLRLARHRLRTFARKATYSLKRRTGMPGDREWSVDAGARFFKIPNNDPYGGIRINLRGREPRGVVRPGAEYAETLGFLESELWKLVNLESGRPLVRDIVRTADHYTGPALEGLPDLMVGWNTDAPINAVGSDRIGRVEGRYTGNRTGDHEPGGLVVVRGPGIPGGTHEPVKVEDLAPSICSLLGVDLSGRDGRSFLGSVGVTASR